MSIPTYHPKNRTLSPRGTVCRAESNSNFEGTTPLFDPAIKISLARIKQQKPRGGGYSENLKKREATAFSNFSQDYQHVTLLRDGASLGLARHREWQARPGSSTITISIGNDDIFSVPASPNQARYLSLPRTVDQQIFCTSKLLLSNPSSRFPLSPRPEAPLRYYHQCSDKFQYLSLLLQIQRHSTSLERILGLGGLTQSTLPRHNTYRARCPECGVGLEGKVPRRGKIRPRMLFLDYGHNWRCCRSGRSIYKTKLMNKMR